MLSDYQRVGVVARGAHSTIWKGFDPGLKRDVALKQLSGSDAAEAARREAAALAALRHPNILSVYDVLEDEQGVWLIEQWITGAPLTAVLDVTGKLRAIDALALIHGALQGLSYAHSRNMIHGDITPANILIDHTGTPMLVDFGLAVAAGQRSLGGTPGYMAPEAAAGQPVDTRSDVYSSCVVLAELLTGTRLFATASTLALTHQQAAAAPQLGGIEAPVAAVLTTGLHPQPDDRPRDGATLLTQLEAAIEETHGRGWLAAAGLGALGSTAATIAAGVTLTGTATTATTTATAHTTAATSAKTATATLSRGKIIAATATVAAVITAIIAFILLRPTPPHPTATQTTTPPPTTAVAATPADPLATIDGTYRLHMLTYSCGGIAGILGPDMSVPVTHHGNTVTIGHYGTGPLNADGSFVINWTTGPYSNTMHGAFANEGGRTIIRDLTMIWDNGDCPQTYTAVKQ
jgi:eukaryotic-like serine/threonine-protein kinase